MENIIFAKRETGWLGGGTSRTEEKKETSVEEVSEKIPISYEQINLSLEKAEEEITQVYEQVKDKNIYDALIYVELAKESIRLV